MADAAPGRAFNPSGTAIPAVLNTFGELVAEVTEDASTMVISFGIVTGTCAELSQGEGRLVRQ